ncbi:MAG TPA: aldose epimerase family protein [Tepidisphaeraceae bacterium]|nr:aldose epimerase family protein [Tepidisphaeraceae bacterium]
MSRFQFRGLLQARRWLAGATLAGVAVCAAVIGGGCSHSDQPASWEFWRKNPQPATATPSHDHLAATAPTTNTTAFAASRPDANPSPIAAAEPTPVPVYTNTPDKKDRTMNVHESNFGLTKDGKQVVLFTLSNKHGLVAKVMNYGATLVQFNVPDRYGKLGDIVLGFDTLADYEAKSPFFGATTGRVANRIAGGSFDLDGATYDLEINNGPNTLHGGKIGFDKKIWEAKVTHGHDGSAVEFHYVSPDMEENFPGNLDVTVTYTLTEHNALRIDYKATTDKATIVNLTNHTYWNLSAMKSPTILDEVMYINADQYTPVDETSIPTGRIHTVAKTVFDFNVPTRIGERIKRVPGGPPVGYDHNYVINGPPRELKLCARVSDPDTSGRSMEVWTTEPGVQFYTGNYLDGVIGHRGHVYNQYAGFCLETQHFPDSIHHPEFPSTVLRPGQTYTQTTIYKLSY